MPKRPPQTFAEALLAARRELHVSMVAVGRKVGVTGRTVSRWEQGLFMPGYRERHRLMEVLNGVSPEVERVLRVTLEVPAAVRTKSDAVMRLAVDSALLAMASAIPGVAVPTLRAALHGALERLRASDVDVARASELLAADAAVNERRDTSR